jgi:hypothetical protein
VHKPTHKRTGEDPLVAEMTVRCLWANVWTSRGRMAKGDEKVLLALEAAQLDAMDAVKIVVRR